MAARLKEFYKSEVAPALLKKFEYKSVMQIPKLDKIVINVGAGDSKENSKVIDNVIAEISAIAGQKAIPTYARKSVANFKLRQGMKIGVKVTLRGEKMYEFIDRLFNFSLPRVRDFKGINPNAFDGRGNYSLGLKEQLIFPEIEYDKVEKIRGMDIAFVTTANTDEEARELLKLLGVTASNIKLRKLENLTKTRLIIIRNSDCRLAGCETLKANTYFVYITKLLVTDADNHGTAVRCNLYKPLVTKTGKCTAQWRTAYTESLR